MSDIEYSVITSEFIKSFDCISLAANHDLMSSAVLSAGPFNSAYCFYLLLKFLSSPDFIQNHLFRKIISGIPYKSLTVWIQIGPDVTSRQRVKMSQ